MRTTLCPSLWTAATWASASSAEPAGTRSCFTRHGRWLSTTRPMSMSSCVPASPAHAQPPGFKIAGWLMAWNSWRSCHRCAIAGGCPCPVCCMSPMITPMPMSVACACSLHMASSCALMLTNTGGCRPMAITHAPIRMLSSTWVTIPCLAIALGLARLVPCRACARVPKSIGFHTLAGGSLARSCWPAWACPCTHRWPSLPACLWSM